MDNDQQILKDQLNKLSKVLRSFVAKGNWSDLASDIAKKFNLNEDKYASFENEILFVLIGLQPKNDFVENIKRELEIDTDSAETIAKDVDKDIFSQVQNEISLMWQEKPSQNNVGQSFEQIILNQARAMQPARPADESGGSTSNEVRSTIEKKPENLPIDKPKISVPNYGSADPYREPLN